MEPSEFSLPLSRFSSESQALANVLAAVAKKHRSISPQTPTKNTYEKPVNVVPPKVVS